MKTVLCEFDVLSGRLEASLCPEVVVAHIDPKKLKKKQTINASVSKCSHKGGAVTVQEVACLHGPLSF